MAYLIFHNLQLSSKELFIATFNAVVGNSVEKIQILISKLLSKVLEEKSQNSTEKSRVFILLFLCHRCVMKFIKICYKIFMSLLVFHFDIIEIILGKEEKKWEENCAVQA
jgi:hypothetical protein